MRSLFSYYRRILRTILRRNAFRSIIDLDNGTSVSIARGLSKPRLENVDVSRSRLSLSFLTTSRARSASSLDVEDLARDTLTPLLRSPYGDRAI